VVPRFKLGHILLGILTYGVLTLWVRERWALSGLEAAIFVCSAARFGALALRKQPATLGWAPILLTAVCVWGVLQLAERWTASAYDTSDAILYWFSAGCLVWLGQQACAAREDRRLFLKGALIAGSVVALAGIVQLFTSEGRVFWLFSSGYTTSVIGPFVNYNHFACFVELLLPIALVLAFEDEWYLVLVACLAASVVASTSRTGTILVIVETAVVFLLRGRDGLARGRWVKLMVLAAAFTCVLGYRLLLDRFSNDPDPFQDRREFLQSSINMVRAQPWHGFGLGAWPSAYRAFAVIDTGLTANHAHNEWIQWAAEGGLPMVAVMAVILALCLPPAVQSVWGVGVVCVFVHALVDYPFLRLGLGAWIFVSIGALRAYARDRCPPQRSTLWAGVPGRFNYLAVAPAIPVLAFGAFLSVKLAWADNLYRRATAAGVERASVLFPDNAEYHFALAQLEPGRATTELERCLALNPFLTNARVELAARKEDEGDRKQAETILLEAARLDTQFAPAWALVNFYFRNRQPDLFWLWARKAADMSYGDLRPLFDLCFLVTSDARVVQERAVTSKRSVEIQFLSYLTSHQRLPEAQSMAQRIAAQPQAGDREPLLNYIDVSIETGRVAEAREIWNAMSGAGVELVNGDFSTPILSHGFDWHLPAVDGVVTAQPRESGPALEMEFSGNQPEQCELLSQIVCLRHSTHYAFQFEYRTMGLPDQTGLAWSLGPRREFALAGSPVWAAAEWRFTASADAERLSLAYHRVPGTTRTEGSLTLRHLRIANE
jgi:hypothetical protein